MRYHETNETIDDIRRKYSRPISIVTTPVSPPKNLQRPGRDAPLRVALSLGLENRG
jgi:hypothetical protein